MKSLAVRQNLYLAIDNEDADDEDEGVIPNLADPVANERGPSAQTDPSRSHDKRKARRVTLPDKAGISLNTLDDDDVQLIDQLVGPATVRKGYARMKGKGQDELPPSLRKMSQLRVLHSVSILQRSTTGDA